MKTILTIILACGLLSACKKDETTAARTQNTTQATGCNNPRTDTLTFGYRATALHLSGDYWSAEYYVGGNQQSPSSQYHLFSNSGSVFATDVITQSCDCAAGEIGRYYPSWNFTVAPHNLADTNSIVTIFTVLNHIDTVFITTNQNKFGTVVGGWDADCH